MRRRISCRVSPCDIYSVIQQPPAVIPLAVHHAVPRVLNQFCERGLVHGLLSALAFFALNGIHAHPLIKRRKTLEIAPSLLIGFEQRKDFRINHKAAFRHIGQNRPHSMIRARNVRCSQNPDAHALSPRQKHFVAAEYGAARIVADGAASALSRGNVYRRAVALFLPDMQAVGQLFGGADEGLVQVKL